MTVNRISSLDKNRIAVNRAEQIKVISFTEVGPHTFRVITESARYGRVAQTVLIFPPVGVAEEGSELLSQR